MSEEIKTLSDKQLFWKTLFETKKLAAQLSSMVTSHVNGVTYDDIPQYGKVHVVAQSGSNLGDNFQSDTFIVTARLLQGQHLSTFIKVLPSNSFLRQAVDESRVHQREINMYQHFFALLREMHADQPIPLDIPDCYYTHLEEVVKGETDGSNTCIVLEDLKTENYRMVDITGGLDYRHCHMALTSLAHYHAQTLNALRTWKDLSTGELSKVPPAAKFIFDEMSMFDMGITHALQNFATTVVDFAKPVNRPDLVEWLTDLQQRLPEIMLVDNLESSGPLACILHGDFWNNNMLFKYAEQSDRPEDGNKENAPADIPVSLKMLDFQQSRIGHPLSDVLYFMYTSTMPELRECHMLDLLRHYFDTLTTDLLVLGISLDNYTWENFMEDYKKRSLMWMFAGVLMITMTQNKQAASTLQDMDEAEQKKGPTSDTAVEPVKGESGLSLEMEEKMKNMMATQALRASSALSDRILKLIMEVKALNDS
ncbi:uncharacterized protein LOC130698642 [Daphnia carinata]|uniref:uncharacterized protein LOC130698642 n=1 Tax=Daphnia carinata TaxID=120202 RepID=UPI00257AAF9E|nr:uncharacterized protein LOC130698642 [Daphnia carinata]XP_057377314.1 uncharacterized protein LOC130698642 [Daphnia carinata]